MAKDSNRHELSSIAQKETSVLAKLEQIPDACRAGDNQQTYSWGYVFEEKHGICRNSKEKMFAICVMSENYALSSTTKRIRKDEM